MRQQEIQKQAHDFRGRIRSLKGYSQSDNFRRHMDILLKAFSPIVENGYINRNGYNHLIWCVKVVIHNSSNKMPRSGGKNYYGISKKHWDKIITTMNTIKVFLEKSQTAIIQTTYIPSTRTIFSTLLPLSLLGTCLGWNYYKSPINRIRCNDNTTNGSDKIRKRYSEQMKRQTDPGFLEGKRHEFNKGVAKALKYSRVRWEASNEAYKNGNLAETNFRIGKIPLIRIPKDLVSCDPNLLDPLISHEKHHVYAFSCNYRVSKIKGVRKNKTINLVPHQSYSDLEKFYKIVDTLVSDIDGIINRWKNNNITEADRRVSMKFQEHCSKNGTPGYISIAPTPFAVKYFIPEYVKNYIPEYVKNLLPQTIPRYIAEPIAIKLAQLSCFVADLYYSNTPYSLNNTNLQIKYKLTDSQEWVILHISPTEPKDYGIFHLVAFLHEVTNFIAGPRYYAEVYARIEQYLEPIIGLLSPAYENYMLNYSRSCVDAHN